MNIIHIPPALADAYCAGNRCTDEELEALIRTRMGIFSCYLLA